MDCMVFKRKIGALLGVAIIVSVGTFFAFKQRYFFINTKDGTYNVYCFSGHNSDTFPKEPNEWVETFWFSSTCEKERARSFNPELSPFELPGIR